MNKIKTKIKELNGSMNEQLVLIVKDSDEIIKLLKLTKKEFDFLADKEIRIEVGECAILFLNNCPLEGSWKNYAFIAPNKTCGWDFGYVVETDFLKECKGTGSWIYLKNEELKRKIFADLKSENYNIINK